MKFDFFKIGSLLLASVIGVAAGAQQFTGSGLVSGSASNSEVPILVRFSGALKNDPGKSLSGTVGITFSLYADAQTPVALWMETQNVQVDAAGRYTVLLGKTKSGGLPVELFTSGEARWLGMHTQFMLDPPRVLLVSVPYAVEAQNAQTLGGLPASAFLLRAPQLVGGNGMFGPDLAPKVHSISDLSRPVTTFGGTPNALARFGAPAEIFPSAIFENQGAIDVVAAQSSLSFHGTGTHSIALVGDRNVALGESAALGAFFSSNSIGTPIRFFVTDGMQHEALHIAPNGKITVGNGLAPAKTPATANIFTVAQGTGHAIADGWDTYSSARWKTNIQTLNGALAKVVQLRGVSYDYSPAQKHDIGMIAEEVGKVVPEVVTYEANGIDAQSIDYARLTAVLVQAVKEQQQEIRRQQKQLQHLKAIVLQNQSAGSKK